MLLFVTPIRGATSTSGTSCAACWQRRWCQMTTRPECGTLRMACMACCSHASRRRSTLTSLRGWCSGSCRQVLRPCCCMLCVHDACCQHGCIKCVLEPLWLLNNDIASTSQASPLTCMQCHSKQLISCSSSLCLCLLVAACRMAVCVCRWYHPRMPPTSRHCAHGSSRQKRHGTYLGTRAGR